MNKHVKCPQCGKLTGYSGANPWRPFCSERCKLLDLGDWIEGNNSIPSDESPVTASPGFPGEVKH